MLRRLGALPLALLLTACAHDDELEALEPEAEELELESIRDDEAPDEDAEREAAAAAAPVPTVAERLARMERDSALICEQAQRDARADIDAGQLVIHTFGLPAPCWFEYTTVVRDELGVSIVNNGCIVGDASREYADCYDEVVETHIDAVHGEEALARARMRACMK